MFCNLKRYSTKTRVGIASLLVAVLFGVTPGMVQAGLIDSMSGHWALDETGTTTTVDNTASTTDGVRGSAVQNGQTGMIGGAYLFGGTTADSNVDTGLMLVSDASDFTLSAWINTSSTTQLQAIFSNNASQTYRCNLLVEAGKLNWFANTGGTSLSVSSADSVNDGEWHFVTVTKSSGSYLLWIDGMQATSESTATTPIQNASGVTWHIGARAGGLNVHNFDGLIDDAASWNRALSSQEIAAIAGLGEFSSLAVNDSQIDDVLALSTVGETALAGNITWAYTNTFADDADGAALTAGMHYIGTDGKKYIILDENAGTMSGVMESTAVPEPSTITLILGAVLAGLAFRKK